MLKVPSDCKYMTGQVRKELKILLLSLQDSLKAPCLVAGNRERVLFLNYALTGVLQHSFMH